jgi:hypothetical protein
LEIGQFIWAGWSKFISKRARQRIEAILTHGSAVHCNSLVITGGFHGSIHDDDQCCLGYMSRVDSRNLQNFARALPASDGDGIH